MGIGRIRGALRRGKYEFTLHALEEMDEDNLTALDVRRALAHGQVVATLGDDPRGARFVVRGPLRQTNAAVEVICRFLSSGLLRIITVYRSEV